MAMINQSLHKCGLRFCRTLWQKCIFYLSKAVLWLRRLVANHSAWRSRFGPRLVRVGFVLDKAAFGQVSLRVLQFSPVTLIPAILLTAILSMCRRKCVIALSLFVSGSLL
jgi:branched-subunit amino acid transport protein